MAAGPRRSRSPRTATSGDYVVDLAKPIVAEQRRTCSSCRTTSADRRSARPGYERQLAEQQAPARRTSGRTSTSGSPSGPCTSRARSTHAIAPAARAGPRARRGRRGLAAHHRLRRRQGPRARSAPTASRPTSPPTPPTTWTSASRGFDRCVYMLGADHHGYVGRLKAIAACAGDDPDAQHRGPDRPAGQARQGRRAESGCRKRAGTIVTLDDLVEAVGVDAAALLARPLPGRLAARPSTSTSCTRRTNDNPVFYVQYAHARTGRDRCATRPSSACAARDGFDPALLDHEQRGDAARARSASSRGSSPAPPSCASRTGSRATSRSCRRYHRLYDELPGAAAGRRGDHRRCTAPGCGYRRHPHGARQRPRPARRVRAGADVGTTDAHEAGALHADVGYRGPPWLRAPRPTSTTLRRRSSGRAPATARRGRRARRSAASTCRDLVAEHGTPAYVLDEADFRARRARDAFTRRLRPRRRRRLLRRQGVPVHRRSARWVAEEGLSLDVCTGGELAVALRGRLPTGSGSACTATTSPTPSCGRALDAGVGRIVVDSFDEIDRLADVAAAARRAARRCWCG